MCTEENDEEQKAKELKGEYKGVGRREVMYRHHSMVQYVSTYDGCKQCT